MKAPFALAGLVGLVASIASATAIDTELASRHYDDYGGKPGCKRTNEGWDCGDHGGKEECKRTNDGWDCGNHGGGKDHHGGDHGGKDGGKHGGECHIPWQKRTGGHGMGGYYDHGWDHPGHYDGDYDHHKGGHDGHKGGHGGGGGDKHCPDPTNIDDTVDEIVKHPGVVVDVTLPLRENNGSIVEIIDSGMVPVINHTAPVLGGGDLPAFHNGSSPATTWGGITSEGMNATHRPAQGTNANAAVFEHAGSTVRFRRGALAAAKRQITLNSQPDPPTPNPDPALSCQYSYQHVLGGDGSPSRGALWALEGYVDLVAADVQQGGIGDCGMGAAIMALASGGWTKLIKNSFVRTGAREGSYEVLLKKDGTTQRVAIDDQLPVLTNANPNCWPYPGYQPVNDAAFPGPDGSYPPTPIFFMPLFEKAFAKFLDANPDWKSTKPEVTGYAGLEGVNPANVLAAITGGTPKSVWRTKSGFDVPILAALLQCMRADAPCVIGTTNSTTLEGLGTLDATQVLWLNPAGDAANPRGYSPGDTSGMVASDAPTSKSTYTIIDFDQVVKTDKGDRSTALTMVGNHAYGFDHSRSTDFPLPDSIESLIDVRMAVLNPWGSNPCQWPGGGCGSGGAFTQPSEVRHSFRTLAQTIAGVFTVENMPAV